MSAEVDYKYNLDVGSTDKVTWDTLVNDITYFIYKNMYNDINKLCFCSGIINSKLIRLLNQSNVNS